MFAVATSFRPNRNVFLLKALISPLRTFDHGDQDGLIRWAFEAHNVNSKAAVVTNCLVQQQLTSNFDCHNLGGGKLESSLHRFSGFR